MPVVGINVTVLPIFCFKVVGYLTKFDSVMCKTRPGSWSYVCINLKRMHF